MSELRVEIELIWRNAIIFNGDTSVVGKQVRPAAPQGLCLEPPLVLP